VIPGSVPFILTGVRQAVSLGLIGVVTYECRLSSERERNDEPVEPVHADE
jgi:ABC-type nitrate/sulfonate/bicarbonate transport system permease component